jgi:hypothetical protein
VNQNDGSFRGTKQLWRGGHRPMNKPMRGEGANRAPVGLVRSVRAGGNVRSIRNRGNSEPRALGVFHINRFRD